MDEQLFYLPLVLLIVRESKDRLTVQLVRKVRKKTGACQIGGESSDQLTDDGDDIAPDPTASISVYRF